MLSVVIAAILSIAWEGTSLLSSGFARLEQETRQEGESAANAGIPAEACAREQLRVAQQELIELRRLGLERTETAGNATGDVAAEGIERDPLGFRARREAEAVPPEAPPAEPGGGEAAARGAFDRVLGLEPPEEPEAPEAPAARGAFDRVLGLEPPAQPAEAPAAGPPAPITVAATAPAAPPPAPTIDDDFSTAIEEMEASFRDFADRIAASMPAPGQLAAMPGVSGAGAGGDAADIFSTSLQDQTARLVDGQQRQIDAITAQTAAIVGALRENGLEVS